MYYVAHRLFAAHDRLLAADLAHRLGRELGNESVFLPFCDTDEERLVADLKGRRLFELDRERLRHLRGLVALVHGPSPDDGVCMEIGYAAALGAPVVLVNTDFQNYSLTPTGLRSVFPDPLLDALATHIIRLPRLGPTPAQPGPSRFTDFAARNRSQLQQAVSACTAAASHLPPPTLAASPRRTHGTVYSEPSPYTPEHDRIPGAVAPAGSTIRLPRRFTAHDPVQTAHGDWTAALSADAVLVDATGPETPPGAAMLVGAACAIGIPVAAYLPRSTYTHAAGREPNRRNLMVQYALGHTLRTPQEVTAWLNR